MRANEEYLMQIRPEIPGLEKSDSYFNSIEQFQNNCLRPIIKYQSDLIYKAFQKEKNLLTILSRGNNSREQTLAIISHYIKTNKALSHLLAGLIVGLMTLNESDFYLNNYKEINKRIFQMISERINSFVWSD